MSDEGLFALASAAPLPGWLALALGRWIGPGRAVAFARLLAAGLAAGYVALIAVSLAGPPGPPVDWTTLGGLAAAFSQPRVMLIGWLHYLALDLWTGTWEAEDAARRGVPALALAPCLALTLLAGPAGLLLYLAVRTGWPRRFLTREAGEGDRAWRGGGGAGRSASSVAGAPPPPSCGRSPSPVAPRRVRNPAPRLTARLASPR